MSGKLIVVAGGQLGSEGKGSVADQLSQREAHLVAVRVAGPNAGHTVVGKCPPGCKPDETNHVVMTNLDGVAIPDGTAHLWKLRSVPVAAVSNRNAHLVIAAGSEVDLAVLDAEKDALDRAGYDVSSRLSVDRSATLLKPHHIFDEQQSDLVKRLGSTAKGIGAARADRVWRKAELFGGDFDSAPWMYGQLRQGYSVLIEGTQGYGLGTHAGMYPQCTSSDCRAIDFLAMAGLSPWHDSVDQLQVWLAARVRPIRVAGNSGPLKGETTWEELGLPEERTTVTNKVRRVGEWDNEMVCNAVEDNGGIGVKLALTMVDTLIPKLAGVSDASRVDNDTARQLASLVGITQANVGTHVNFVGTGPATGIFLR
jgi:adenylosuccinate synthase